MDAVVFSTETVGAASRIHKRAAGRKRELMSEKTLEGQREAQEKLFGLLPLPAGIEVLPAGPDGLYCEWIFRPEAHQEKVILYLHGGGWVMGSPEIFRPAAALLAEHMPYKVLAVNYRLAPEHKFPAGLHDSACAYRWLLAQGYQPQNIALIGDSAGGNLCLSLIGLLLDMGTPIPCAVVGISPVTDLSDASMLVREPPPFAHAFYQGERRTIFELYLDSGQNTEDPLVSPIFARLGEYPPILIHVGGDEELAADCAAFAKKAQAQGADALCKVWREMFHDFSIVGPTLKESRLSLAEIAGFLEKHLKGVSAAPLSEDEDKP